jgi:hypothetical protein
MATDKNQKTDRKPYSAPALKVHGSAAELTGVFKPPGSGDASFNENSVVASDRAIKRDIRPLR